MGNLFSVKRRFESLGASVRIAESVQDISEAERLVLPGVGHFGKAMESLASRGMVEGIKAFAAESKPLLGICLGMQLLAESSEEGDSTGLGLVPGRIVKFRVKDSSKYKVPHTGWNTLEDIRPEGLLEGVKALDEYYFVHAYHYNADLDEQFVAARTRFEYSFPSVVCNGSVMGAQFHPEKSHDTGLAMLKNFLHQ